MHVISQCVNRLNAHLDVFNAYIEDIRIDESFS